MRLLLSLLLAAVAMACLPPAAARAVNEAGAGQPGRLYAVIFAVTIDSEGKVESLRVDRVIDTLAASADPVAIALPDSFVAAARTALSAKLYSGRVSPFFTYVYYDPARPEVADLGASPTMDR